MQYKVVMSKNGTKYSACVTFYVNADSIYEAERKAKAQKPNLLIVEITPSR